MDSLTQAALGAVVGELVLGRQLGRRSIAWGALFGTLPDLDALLNLLTPTAWGLVIHRGFTHSLIALALVTWLLSRPLATRWKKDKVTRKRAAVFVFLAWSTHVLIDVFNSYGTGVLDPLPLHRLGTSNMAIIDPIFTLPLLVAVIIGFFVQPKDWKKGKGVRAAAWCTGISTLYVGLSFWAKFSIRGDVTRDLARRGVTHQRVTEGPTLFNIILWRALVDRPGEIWIGYRSIFDEPDQPIRWTVVPKHEEVADAYADVREVKIVTWFAQDWWIARKSAEGVWFADLRFAEMRSWDQRGVALRFPFTWNFSPESKQDRLRQLSPDRDEPAEMLRRMARRASGETSAYEGESLRIISPGLALQEYLETR